MSEYMEIILNDNPTDFTCSMPDDVVSPNLYKSSIYNCEYWFGYRFNGETTSKQRSKFISYIKGLDENRISEQKLRKFIGFPLMELERIISINKIDCFVYPISQRSDIVEKIVSAINDYILPKIRLESIEFVKKPPAEIDFDWQLLEAETVNDINKYNQMKDYAENILMPSIKKLDYFSIAQSVKPKYRKYIRNFLQFRFTADIERFSELNGENIMIIDDINTTGSTINEILSVLNNVNSNCRIFVYTLIGNF